MGKSGNKVAISEGREGLPVRTEKGPMVLPRTITASPVLGSVGGKAKTPAESGMERM